jgi:hypothetical protein
MMLFDGKSELLRLRVSRTGDRAYLRAVGGGQCVLEDWRLILRFARPLVGEQRGGAHMNTTWKNERDDCKLCTCSDKSKMNESRTP